MKFRLEFVLLFLIAKRMHRHFMKIIQLRSAPPPPIATVRGKNKSPLKKLSPVIQQRFTPPPPQMHPEMDLADRMDDFSFTGGAF
jgi:hypothetical protein